jgi:hypothetical protein
MRIRRASVIAALSRSPGPRRPARNVRGCCGTGRTAGRVRQLGGRSQGTRNMPRAKLHCRRSSRTTANGFRVFQSRWGRTDVASSSRGRTGTDSEASSTTPAFPTPWTRAGRRRARDERSKGDPRVGRARVRQPKTRFMAVLDLLRT